MFLSDPVLKTFGLEYAKSGKTEDFLIKVNTRTTKSPFLPDDNGFLGQIYEILFTQQTGHKGDTIVMLIIIKSIKKKESAVLNHQSAASNFASNSSLWIFNSVATMLSPQNVNHLVA